MVCAPLVRLHEICKLSDLDGTVYEDPYLVRGEVASSAIRAGIDPGVPTICGYVIGAVR
jgi:hypothetical protein